MPRALNEHADSLSLIWIIGRLLSLRSVISVQFSSLERTLIGSPMHQTTRCRISIPVSFCQRLPGWMPSHSTGGEGGVCNWAVPPIYLIPRLLLFIIAQPCLVILVIPKWPSAIFWAKYLDFCEHQARFVCPVLHLGNIFSCSQHSSSIFDSS